MDTFKHFIKQIIMNHTIKLDLKHILILLSIYLQGCCWTDHSDTIKKVAVPMQKELEKFYVKNRRFPTTKERDEMLKRVGCKMEGNVCVYEGERMAILLWKISYDYKIRIDLENTECLIGMDDTGRTRFVGCGNSPCINLRQ